MQISCPQCATSYELDARLLPPGGAPVQCTRCSHVFVAQPTAPAAAAASTQPAPDDDLDTREQPPARADRTQIYGRNQGGAGAPPPSGPPQQIPTGTQVYGSGPASARTTQMFGVPAAQAKPSSSSTQIFGAVQGPAPSSDAPAAPPAQRSSSSTQLFGAVAGGAPSSDTPAVQPPQRISTSTQIFGSVPGPAAAAEAPPAPRVSSSTQIFGSVGGSSPPAPAPSQAPAPAPQTPPARISTSTQIFGAVPPRPAGTSESAVEAPKRSSSNTQIFGAVPPSGAPSTPPAQPAPPAPQPGPRSTHVYGLPVPAQTKPAAPQRDDSDAATVLYGGPALGAQPAPEQPSFQSDVPESGFEPTHISRRPEADTEPEFEANDSAPAPVPARAAPSDSVGAPVGGRRMTSANAAAPRMLEPFDPPAALTGPRGGDELGDDPAAAFVAAQKRRRNVVLGVIGAAVLGLAGFAAFRTLANRPVPTPAEAIAAHSAAMNVLRRDDPDSLAAAVVQLDAVSKQWPAFSEARTSHLVALLFQLDDVRLNLERIKQQSDRLNTQIARLKERKAPSDWENRVNALIDQLEALKKDSDPLVERATALDGEVNTAFRVLQEKLQVLKDPEDELQLVRGQAVYFGVKGNDQAVALSERYRVIGGAEGWGDVAYAEYALNTRVAPDTRKQAIEALEGLKSNDASFIRVYVLLGRLALADKGWDPAVSAFEAALALNPKHETARLLLEQARQLKAASAESAPAPE